MSYVYDGYYFISLTSIYCEV